MGRKKGREKETENVQGEGFSLVSTVSVSSYLITGSKKLFTYKQQVILALEDYSVILQAGNH